jgi:hypothetical protein
MIAQKLLVVVTTSGSAKSKGGNMKRIAILVGLTALLVAIFATTALTAGYLQCTSYPCYGNNNPNYLFERRGDGTPDYIVGKGGRDDLDAGRQSHDRDTLYGNNGNDNLITLDNDSRDKAIGGAGRHDRCVVDDRSEAGGGCNKLVFSYGP